MNIYLVVLRFGQYNSRVVERLGFLCDALSSVAPGEMLIYGRQALVATKPAFSIRCLGSRAPMGPLRRARYALWVLWRCAVARARTRRSIVVIAYDPFQSGAIGLACKWLLGTKLICELNGVFQDVLALEQSSGWSRRLRLAVARTVLLNSDAIKTLYDGQEVGMLSARSNAPISAFHNLVDTGAFTPSPPQGSKTLLFVGHPFHLKGCDLLLRAFADLTADFPEWSLVLVGHRLREEIAASGLSVPARTTVLPGVSPMEVAALMTAAAALVLPSRSEAMGRVLVEAAHVGRPRIASKVGGIPSVVEDGVDGLLFEIGDVDSLREALRRFMSDLSLQTRLSEGAAARAQRDFTPEKYASSYQSLVLQAVSIGTVSQ